jgi:Zn-dependent peptidase ImmA (M78 family)
MMIGTSWRHLALDALAKAETVRRAAGLKMNDPACVYTIAKKLGLQVRFEKMSGLDGFYHKGKKLILISSLRPQGRQTFSCAHELGHHVYGHGFSVTLGRDSNDVVEQIKRNNSNPDEYLVNRFASFLLMPKIAVKHAFLKRGWSPETSAPEQIYIIAGWLGIGYATLVYHMQSTLSILDAGQTSILLSAQPKDIREKLFGEPCAENLVVVDAHWFGRAIDVQRGDFIQTPRTFIAEGGNLVLIKENENGMVYRSLSSGIGKLVDTSSDWSAFVRVSKREFVGLSDYRHLEDPDEDDGDG